MPIVDKIKALGPQMESLSNDELRDAINQVRQSIAESTSKFEESNKELRAKVEELPFDERQPIWDEIDANEKKILDIIEDQLNEHLPTVFAAVKETAARFATATSQPKAVISYQSKAIKLFGKTIGLPVVMK